mgnify:FL=1
MNNTKTNTINSISNFNLRPFTPGEYGEYQGADAGEKWEVPFIATRRIIFGGEELEAEIIVCHTNGTPNVQIIIIQDDFPLGDYLQYDAESFGDAFTTADHLPALILPSDISKLGFYSM